MCDPVTIGTVAAVASASATVYGGYQAKQQGDAANETAKYNARLSENEAIKTRNKGAEEENQQRRRTAELISSQRASLGASGVEVGSGSALQLQTDAATLGEADALRIRSNFGDAAQGLDDQAELTRIEGKNAKSAGKNAFTGSILSAAGTFAGSTGGQSVASKWFGPSSASSSGLVANARTVARPTLGY